MKTLSEIQSHIASLLSSYTSDDFPTYFSGDVVVQATGRNRNAVETLLGSVGFAVEVGMPLSATLDQDAPGVGMRTVEIPVVVHVNANVSTKNPAEAVQCVFDAVLAYRNASCSADNYTAAPGAFELANDDGGQVTYICWFLKTVSL